MEPGRNYRDETKDDDTRKMTRGQPCVQRARPQPHPWEVVIPKTRTGREHQRPSIDSGQRREYKLKARQARTEAEKYHPRHRHHSIHTSSPSTNIQADKVLADSPRVAIVRRSSAGLPKSRGGYKMFSHALSEPKTCTCTLPPFPVSIRSDSFATDFTRLKKFGREVQLSY